MSRNLLIALPIAVLAVSCCDCPPPALTSLYLTNLEAQDFTLDQNSMRGDPTCQSDLYCSSWQVLDDSETEDIEVSSPSELFLVFEGNYNWASYGGPLLIPNTFVQVQLQMSTNNGPFEPQSETSLTRATWVPNAGMDVIRTRLVPLPPGSYRVRVAHRFSVSPTNSLDIDQHGLTEGSLRVIVTDA